jgi:hypothetical protein
MLAFGEGPCYKGPVHARMLYAVALIVAAVLVPAGSAQAAITVANTKDSGPGSLRQAIAGAPPGETIVVPAGTYTLTSAELKIEKSLSISGNGSAGTIIRSGGAFRVFFIQGSGNSVTISGVTIRDGHDSEPGGIRQGGGVLNYQSNLTLRNVVVTNNRADVNGGAGQGGGIAEGGGIFSEDGALTVENSTVSGNVATAVGGSGGGGGIAEGGGLGFFGGPSLTIRNSTFAGNVANVHGGSGGGGGIAEGGGLFLEIGPTTAASISATTVNGNLADATGGSGGGGGIAEGGGVRVESEQPSTSLSNLTIAGNTARAPGGGGGGLGGIAEGGGLYLDLNNNAIVTLTSATVVGNTVDSPGGIAEGGNIDRDPGFKIANSIVSGGKAPPGEENCDDPLESQGFNLESANQCGFKAVGDQVNKNPLLGPLQSNGGPSPTMAPAANSPVVDQGRASGLSSDQRAVIRPIDFPTIANSAAAGADGSDIGAVELQPSNAFVLGKLKKNKKKGTATLTVILPQPSAGTLTLAGKGLKTKSKAVAGQETLKLPVIGKGKVKKALRKRGKRKVAIKVTYTPTGNEANTLTRKAKLVKKKRKRKKGGKRKGGKQGKSGTRR